MGVFFIDSSQTYSTTTVLRRYTSGAIGSVVAVEEGYGHSADLDRIESGGCIEGAAPDLISRKAYERGRAQQGTLGSGNHFLEVQAVDEVTDPATAAAFGLEKGSLAVGVLVWLQVLAY